jgi:hypothetical protein
VSDYLTTAQVADLLELAPSTIRRYHSRGDMPPCDRRYGATPLWLPETIRVWRESRPGKGVGGGRPRKEART